MRASESNTGKGSPQRGSLDRLSDCLVDCDPATVSRAGHSRRRALGVSAITQAVAVGVLLLVPLFATGSKLIGKTITVTVPYGGGHHDPPASHPPQSTARDQGPRPPHNSGQIVAPTQIPHNIDESGRGEDAIPSVAPVENATRDQRADGPGWGLLPGFPPATGPKPPEAPATSVAAPTRPIEVSQFTQLSLLIHKVEPVYPALAKMTHREGTVQLHAIISRDGRVVNLEVLSGDGLLVASARDAVLQWRFRPTVLNGQPVEVETYITVIFRLGQ